jgi:ATP-dependent exoDNAse (exonuclease V) alpha subunit
MSGEAQIMMNKELVYTAMTRAQKKLEIYGHSAMLRLSPTRSAVRQRYTNTVEMINEAKGHDKTFKILGG